MAMQQKRIARLRRRAVELVQQDELLAQRFRQPIGIPGIAEIGAVQLLSELAALDPQTTVRQWVAHSRLDPAHRVSGTSVNEASRIGPPGQPLSAPRPLSARAYPASAATGT
jgi:hypothetical protein